MKKLSAKWVRVVASEQCLGMFQRNLMEFLRRYVTVDKTWIYYYTPETKNQSKMWTGPGESAPKKAKTLVEDINRLSTEGKKLLQENIVPHY